MLRDLHPVLQYIERLAHVDHHIIASKKEFATTPRQELARIAQSRNYSRLPKVSRTLLLEVEKVLRD